ncbi:MAG TPA: hypothetical protein H9744_03175 [Candidatus Eisenbergiella stercoravium]|nr:hypothetical protein [Candidatus Eisenbergiella stercoravium]
MKTDYFEEIRKGKKRSTAYLEHVISNGQTNVYLKGDLQNNFETVYFELARLELFNRGIETGPIHFPNIQRSLHRVNERLDCGDFVIPAFLTILYRYQDSDLLTKEMLQELEDAVLNFKYWIDEPGVDVHLPCYFTENHQVLFHSIEYLAGQLYPDRIFTNNGKNGAWHREHGRTYLKRWLTWRKRFGFSEWLSNGYYAEDMLGLMILSQLAEEEAIRGQAEGLIELLLFDIAVHSFKGSFCPTNGRMYNGPTMNPDFSSANALAAEQWGRGYVDGGMEQAMAAILLAVYDYQCNEVICDIALNPPKESENKQRMSLNVEDSERYGIDPSDFDNIMLYWSLHTFYHRDVIKNSRKFCPEWYNIDAAVTANLEKFRMCDAAGVYTDPDPNASALTQVEIYTYKTEDYMLSCAQNYRKGRGNFQQHIWQASLGGRAIVFATHPGSGEYNGRPNYFVGNGCMPKATAYKNVLISIHRIPADDPHGLCTHAYFPQREFDEVVMKNGWIIGRKDDGYAALYSLKKGWWNDKNPELFRSIYKTNWEAEYERALPYDYWVPGHANVWICELGSRKEYGSFEKFVEAVSKAKVEGDTFSIRYQSPSLGLVTSGWDEPFVVDGQEIQVDHYKRYDNPYCQAEFDTDQYVISYHGKTMTVDFKDKEII